MASRGPTVIEAAGSLAQLALQPAALTSRAGLQVLGGSLALGLAGDALFYQAALGINIAIWVLAFICVFGLCLRTGHRSPSAHQVVLLALAFAFAAMIAWRGSQALQALNLLASLGCLTLAVALPRGARLRRESLLDLAAAGVGALVGLAAGVPRVALDGEWTRRIGVRSRENTLVVGRVVLLGAPLLAVFGGLFIAADAVVQSSVEKAFSIEVGGLFEHAWWLTTTGWFACGLLWLGLTAQLPAGVEAELPEDKRLRPLETGAVLGSLVVLFAVFVLVQLRYLFGGESHVQETIGLTYAEYARRGFFELVAAAALLLPVLLAFDWARRRDGRSAAVFRVLAGLLVLLLAVVMASALQRMRVYVDAFGLTELRLYVLTFLCFLVAVFAWFLWTVLRGRRNEFTLGAGAAGLAALVVLNVINPDYQIARTNTSRLADGREFDAYHASHLGPEAAPVLAARLNRLNAADACLVAEALLTRWSGASDGIRSWNVGRDQARHAVREYRKELEAACGAARS